MKEGGEKKKPAHAWRGGGNLIMKPGMVICLLWFWGGGGGGGGVLFDGLKGQVLAEETRHLPN